MTDQIAEFIQNGKFADSGIFGDFEGDGSGVIRCELSAKREAGESLRAIAADADVSPQTVMRRCNTETVYTEKALQPRKVTQYKISHYTKPTTAAAKIRATFGDTTSSIWPSVGHFGYGSYPPTGCGFEPAGEVSVYTDALKKGWLLAVHHRHQHPPKTSRDSTRGLLRLVYLCPMLNSSERETVPKRSTCRQSGKIELGERL